MTLRDVKTEEVVFNLDRLRVISAAYYRLQQLCTAVSINLQRMEIIQLLRTQVARVTTIT